MDDAEFLSRFKERVEKSSATTIELMVSEEEPARVSIDFRGPVPRITLGADALKYPGLARVFMEYIILSLRQGKEVDQEEFLLHLRRN
ncbi:MAG: hypothetical protein HYU29_09290 [Chloroflexi bacterium]|nr:hypothetical protein [Chloroflexota bacterium]